MSRPEQSDAGRAVRYPIAFDRWYRFFSAIVGLPASAAHLEIAGEDVEVRMGWAFRSRFRRAAIASVKPLDIRPLSRGVHGFGGRWLVNGAGRGILRIELQPPQRARVLGLPVRLRELLVSVSDGPALTAALGAAATQRR